MASEGDTEGAPPPNTNLLKKKRKELSGHRGYITTTVTKCDTILKSYTQADKVKIKTLRVILKERADILKDLD